jgi:hypothetical protein
VVRLEKQTGTFVVEFSIQDPSGESLELVHPTLAAEIVTTFQKSVLK